MGQDNLILLAEVVPHSASDIADLLRLLGYRTIRADTGEAALSAVGREVVHVAIVAAELTYRGRPVLAYLAALPSMRRLLAVGPAGQDSWEICARRAGAGIYLSRPVTAERLTQTLGGFFVRDRVAESP